MICELRNITKSYPPPSGGSPLVVLNGVTLALRKGESAAVIGPSGSGKTTLLHIAAMLDLPDGGDVLVDGRHAKDICERDFAAARNKKIGVVFQRHNLLPQCTLIENVLVPTLPYQNKTERAASYDRALRLLERLDLSNRLDHFPAQLSGGECQRAALARALVNRPSLLCADEPTGSLDQKNAITLGELLREINKEEETALLLVTHSEKLAVLMDKTYTLSNGKLYTHHNNTASNNTFDDVAYDNDTFVNDTPVNDTTNSAADPSSQKNNRANANG